MQIQKMDGQTATARKRETVLSFPALHGYAMGQSDPAIRQPSWIKARLYELGALAMSEEPTRPPGFFVNWTTVTSLIIIVSAIAGLWFFTWQTAEQRGFEKGKAESEKQRLEKELEAVRKEIFVLNEKQKLQEAGK
jgi:hypothetical protein